MVWIISVGSIASTSKHSGTLILIEILNSMILCSMEIVDSLINSFNVLL
jgi:hypothetical protein